MSETVALGGVDPCSRRNPPIELPEPPRQPVLLTVRVEPGDDVGSDLSRSVSLKISCRVVMDRDVGEAGVEVFRSR